MRWVWAFVASMAFFGLSLMVCFVLNGSYVDSNGYLIEEFWAWGLGVGLLSIALCAAFAIVTVRFVKCRWNNRRLRDSRR